MAAACHGNNQEDDVDTVLVDLQTIEYEGEKLRCAECGRYFAELVIAADNPRPACVSCVQRRRRQRVHVSPAKETR